MTSRFESIRMSDDESFDEFCGKLNDIVNSTFNLGEVFDQSKIVRKILRSLTEDFRSKVTVITESKDVDSIFVVELVWSLQSNEFDLPKTNKSKSMALKSIDDVDDCGFDDELSSTEFAYLVKNFRNFWEIIIEGQEIETMLTLRMWRRMIQLKITILKNIKIKLFNLLTIL